MVYQHKFIPQLVALLLVAVGGAYLVVHTTQSSSVVAEPPKEYPEGSGWFVHTVPGADPANFRLWTKQKTLPNCVDTELACFGEQISLNVATTSMNQGAYIAELLKNIHPSNQTWETVSGQKLYRVTYTTDAYDAPMQSAYLFIDNKVFELTLFPDKPENRAVFEEIIHSYFQSLTSTRTPPEGRATYTNTGYGFSFMYPNNWRLTTTTDGVVLADSPDPDLAISIDAYPLDAKKTFNISCPHEDAYEDGSIVDPVHVESCVHATSTNGVAYTRVTHTGQPTQYTYKEREIKSYFLTQPYVGQSYYIEVGVLSVYPSGEPVPQVIIDTYNHFLESLKIW